MIKLIFVVLNLFILVLSSNLHHFILLPKKALLNNYTCKLKYNYTNKLL